MGNNCQLIVNGKDITENVYVHLNLEQRYAELPLTAVAKALGASVKWEKATRATIKFDGKKYVLDTAKNSLYDRETNANLIALPPGTPHAAYYQVRDGEFIVDSDTMWGFVYLMGARIKINFDERIITIE